MILYSFYMILYGFHVILYCFSQNFACDVGFLLAFWSVAPAKVLNMNPQIWSSLPSGLPRTGVPSACLPSQPTPGQDYLDLPSPAATIRCRQTEVWGPRAGIIFDFYLIIEIIIIIIIIINIIIMIEIIISIISILEELSHFSNVMFFLLAFHGFLDC